MRKNQAKVSQFISEIKNLGGTISLRDSVLDVSAYNVGDDCFDDLLFKFQMACYGLCAGHAWGTDGVGYLCNKSRHYVNVNKCVPKSIANEFAKQLGWEFVTV
jgi:hypothetical protein